MSDRPHVIVGLGEVLWDVFPDGARLGGAPANFACHAASLAKSGDRVTIVSSVGDDDLGHEAIDKLGAQGLDTSTIQISERPTGRVLVNLDEEGKATYDFAADSAWDRLTWTDGLQTLAEQTDAVCFGSLGQRSETSRATIQRFVAAMPPQAICVFDINIRPPFVERTTIESSLQLANVLKLNDEELDLLAEMFDLRSDAPQAMLQELIDRFELRAAALTRGAEGSLLIRGKEISDRPAVLTDVIDTVGAGDSFTATLTRGLLRGCELDAINQNAAEVAAFVCGQPGATPDLPSELRQMIAQRC
jgi:fructokinase